MCPQCFWLIPQQGIISVRGKRLTNRSNKCALSVDDGSGTNRCKINYNGLSWTVSNDPTPWATNSGVKIVVSRLRMIRQELQQEDYCGSTMQWLQWFSQRRLHREIICWSVAPWLSVNVSCVVCCFVRALKFTDTMLSGQIYFQILHTLLSFCAKQQEPSSWASIKPSHLQYSTKTQPSNTLPSNTLLISTLKYYPPWTTCMT